MKTRRLKNEEIWSITVKGIRENILSEKWEHEDWVVQGLEGRILYQLNLKGEMLSPSSWKQPQTGYTIRNVFATPQLGFIKLKYNGASKGNPGQVSVGGIFKGCT